MDKKKQQEAYKNYVKKKTPVHSLPKNMARAIVTGGAGGRNSELVRETGTG